MRRVVQGSGCTLAGRGDGADACEVRTALTIALCVAAGLELGVMAHQRDAQHRQLARTTILQRGAQATAAASAVQSRLGAMRMARVTCPNRPLRHWTCVAQFARRDGGVLDGPRAPRVEVRFSGADRMRLDGCRLVLPARGGAVDCTAEAGRAVRGAAS